MSLSNVHSPLPLFRPEIVVCRVQSVSGVCDGASLLVQVLKDTHTEFLGLQDRSLSLLDAIRRRLKSLCGGKETGTLCWSFWTTRIESEEERERDEVSRPRERERDTHSEIYRFPRTESHLITRRS